MDIDIVSEAIRILNTAHFAYKYSLIVYYLIAILVIYFYLKNWLKTSNINHFGLFRILIISIVLSPTIIVDSGSAAFSPAIFAVGLSIYFSKANVFFQGIIAIVITQTFIFTMLILYKKFTKTYEKT